MSYVVKKEPKGWLYEIVSTKTGKRSVPMAHRAAVKIAGRGNALNELLKAHSKKKPRRVSFR